MENLPVMQGQKKNEPRNSNLETLQKLFPSCILIPGVATGEMPPEMHSHNYTANYGQRGCAMAHRELWAMLKDKPGVHLVLEDDAIIKSEHSSTFCQTTRELMDGMARDGTHAINLRPYSPDSTKEHFSQGLVAYAISQEGARLAYEETDSVQYPIDEQMVRLCSRGTLTCSLVSDSWFDIEKEVDSTMQRFST